MKRLLSTLITAVLLLTPVTAFEWGGLIDNNSTIKLLTDKNNPFAFTQANSVYLWGSSSLTKSGNVYIKGEGMYKFTLDAPQNKITHLADLDLLKAAGDFQLKSGSISFAAGRFFISDITAAVFAQNCDGVLIKYDAQKFGISAYAGYTGLLNSNAVTMLDAKGAAHTPVNEVYALANPYMPVCATVSLPNLFLNQTLTFSANIFTDFSDAKFNRYYAAVALSGPVSSNVFYDFVTDFGTLTFQELMNYSKFTLTVFGPSNMMFAAGVEYAAGNHGLSAFKGFSSRPAYSASTDVETSGVLIPSVSAAIPFGSNMLLSSSVKAVFSCPEKDFSATGVQGNIDYIFNILSDVQIGASVSGFKGFAGNEMDKFSATLKAALSF